MKKDYWIGITFIIVPISILIILINVNKSNIVSNNKSTTNNIKTIDTAPAPQDILAKAEARGFKKGIIQHCLNTLWDKFKDKEYYSFIKTLKSGIKLYRAEMDNMMLEVYVQNGYIKMQSSNFILYNQTKQVIKEMDAWLMSCEPTSVKGDIASSKIYNFNNYDVTLRNEDIGIHYMITCRNSNPAIENKATIDIPLEKLYSNEYFSIKFPTSWQVIKDDNKVTNCTSISVQIMEKKNNDYDFRPNINIIVSGKKRLESAETLANITISQNRQAIPSYQLLCKDNSVALSHCQGCRIEQQFSIQNYKLRNIQYIVKNPDNIAYTITATMDASKYSTQVHILKQIINSLIIK